MQDDFRDCSHENTYIKSHTMSSKALSSQDTPNAPQSNDGLCCILKHRWFEVTYGMHTCTYKYVHCVFALHTTVQNLEVDTVFCFISLLRLKKGPCVSKLVTQIQIILL